MKLLIPDNRAMHLLIPFAFASSEGCRQALSKLKLPHLEKLLSRLTPEPLDLGDEFSLSPPHERALAHARKLPLQDGLIPWAALQAQEMDEASGAWGFITPCHWQLGTHHVTMSGQELPDFSMDESKILLSAMRPYFEEDGINLHYDQPNRWLARGGLFADLATASLDRVVGRNLEHWMPRAANAAPLRRLQNEMQMLLYTHPVNDARAARGVPVVNSFWLSGTGALPRPWPPAAAEPPPVVVNTLRAAALNEDWAAWARAWQQLDTSECAALLAALDRGARGHLTLCGESNAQTFTMRPQTYLKRFMSLFGTRSSNTLLEQL